MVSEANREARRRVAAALSCVWWLPPRSIRGEALQRKVDARACPGNLERVRHAPIPSALFARNRRRLREQLPPGALVILNANDVLPTNADGTLRMVPNTDLFYLSGVEQEETRSERAHV